MAVKNRTEATTEVNTKIVPTVTNATHRDLLNNDILNSTVFRKDIIATETEAGGNVTINYSNKDTATVTTAVNLAVSFTNIENGDVKYLEITKSAANTISFAGATDVSIRKSYINTGVTVVQYVIRNKNNVITVESINIDNDQGHIFKDIEIGDWNMDITASVSVAHGLGITTIKQVWVSIRSDEQAPDEWDLYPLSVGGSTVTNTTNVVISRDIAGVFDNTTFDATSWNRGYITIEYIL